MKKLLLTTAIVAVAGGAMAEITWSGDAEVGYKSHYKATEAGNDANGNNVWTDKGDYAPVDENGDGDTKDSLGVYFTKTKNISPVYFEAGINAKASQEFDNGVSASLNYDFDLSDPGTSGEVTPGSNAITFNEGFPTLRVEAPVGILTVGEVDHAAHALVKTPYEALAGFTEDKDDLVMRGDVTVSGVDAAVSYVLADTKDNGMDVGLNVNSYTMGVKGEFSGFTFAMGNQVNVDGGGDGITAPQGDTSSGGLRLGYNAMGIDGGVYFGQGYNGSTDKTYQTVGLMAAYTMANGVKLGGEYSVNQGKDIVQDKNGNLKSQYASYKVWAGFNAMGADITLGYKNKNDVYSQYSDGKQAGQSGVFLDGAYTIEGTGVKIVGGYDATDKITEWSDYQDWKGPWNKPEDYYGAYYVGAYYDLGNGAMLKGTYSNGTDINPDENIKPGATLAVSLSF